MKGPFTSFFLFICILVLINSCQRSSKPFKTHAPERVGSIPENAFWVGGEDGGNWYLYDEVNKTNRTVKIKIYDDFSGDLITDKLFKLNCPGDSAIEWGELRNLINAYDGKRVYLTLIRNGKYCFLE